MTGSYQHTIDAKGRIFVPAKLREELGDIFYVTISTEKCLSAYSELTWSEFMDKVKSMPYIKQKKMRPLFSHAAKCELDNQGRILLPAMLRDFAGLTKNVTIVGNGLTTEFWDTDTWNSVDEVETSPESIATAFAELEF